MESGLSPSDIMKSATSTPTSSGMNTPDQTRPSSPVHHEHSQSTMKKLWKDIKHHVAEHHRSVNLAYASYYAAGHGLPQPKSFGQNNARIA